MNDGFQLSEERREAMNVELISLCSAYQEWLDSPFTKFVMAEMELLAEQAKDEMADGEKEERKANRIAYLKFKGLADGKWFKLAYTRRLGRIAARYASEQRAADAKAQAVEGNGPHSGKPRVHIPL